MAKANDTAMEEMVKYLKDSKERSAEGMGVYWEIIEKARGLMDKQQSQIEAAFNAGKSGAYKDAQHYFFMEYIDND